MKLKDVLVKVGTGIFSDMVPGGNTVLSLINGITGHADLSPESTGRDVESALESLTPPDRIRLLESEIEMNIAEINGWSRVQEVLSQADQAGASTRPFIAKLMAFAVLLSIVLLMLCFVVAMMAGNEPALLALSQTWPALLAILGTPAALLRSYFGLRTSEKKSRYAASIGQTVPSVGGAITDLLKKGG